MQKQVGLTFGSSFHLQNVVGVLVQKRAWCKFLSPKHLGDRYCAITSRSCLSKKKKKVDLRLSLDCTEKEKNLSLAFFLWVLCTVYGTRKYKIWQNRL